jgi:hypothetical protein
VASNGATSTPGWRNGTKVDTEATYRFDPVDREQMRWLGRLPPGQRVRVMLEARELAVGLMRGRLRRQHPHLSAREINLKLLEELSRAERTPPRL